MTGRRLVLAGTLLGVVLLWLCAAFAAEHHHFDLRIYAGAVRDWRHGGSLYDYQQPGAGTLGFTYPPFAALLMTPLAVLPVAVSGWVADIATAGCAALVTGFLVQPVARRQGWPPWGVFALAVPVVGVLDPVRETIGYGQVNGYLVVLVLADLVLLRRSSRAAGVGIGLATAVKLTPGLFVVFLLVTRRTRAGLTAAGTALGASLLAFAVAPHTSVDFWTRALFDTSRVGSSEPTSNQSLAGMLTRLVDVRETPTALWLPVVAVVLVAGLRHAARLARAGDELAAFTVTGLLASLASPISWTHHLWWVVPAAAVLLDDGLQRRSRARLAGGAFVVVLFASSLVRVFHQEALHHSDGGLVWFLGENSFVLACLVLALTLPARPSERRVSLEPAGGQPGRAKPVDDSGGGARVRGSLDRSGVGASRP